MKIRSHYHLMKEASKGLAQQMILWGHDVKHPAGNTLQRFGMERVESTGLKGTSCYRMEWEGGMVQLHGAVASWHSCDPARGPGCIFCRTQKRIKVWSEKRAPIPGVDEGHFAQPEATWEAFLPMQRWLIAYEQWVIEHLGREWRQQTWRAQFALVKKSPWLAPESALQWWQQSTNRPALSA